MPRVISTSIWQNDYYAAGETWPGQWIGAGAERLRLNQTVTREQFHALCENENPENDERLTQRQLKDDQRRVFYDFTCSAPKSVSVLAVTFDDQRLVEAHEESKAFRRRKCANGRWRNCQRTNNNNCKNFALRFELRAYRESLCWKTKY